jgi:hypothetical protein
MADRIAMTSRSACVGFAVLVALAPSAAVAWEKSLLVVCKTMSAYTLSKAGALTTENSRGSIEFTADIETGLVRLKYAREGAAIQFSAIQRGDAENDTVIAAPTAKALADAVNIFVRIRDWRSSEQITFMWVQGTSVSTGVCVRPL